jgi:hypothetical protein
MICLAPGRASRQCRCTYQCDLARLPLTGRSWRLCPSDDEYEGRGRRGFGGRQKADYSKPVGFVSSGLIKHGDDDNEEEEAKEGEAAGC